MTDTPQPLRLRRPRTARVKARHIHDLRALARKRLPRAAFDYMEGGSFEESTLHRNEADLAGLRLRQRVMTDVSSRTTATTIAGQPAAMPVALAPVGMGGMIGHEGEAYAARAAAAFGVPYCLSTFSTCTIEDVAAAVGGPFMFQFYIFKDRDVNAALIERARAAGCSALIVTMDADVMAPRHRDTRNGLSVPLRLGPRFIIDVLRHPAWLAGYALSKRKTFGNIAPFVPGKCDIGACSAWLNENYKGSHDRADLEWVRESWPGKLIVKGLLDPDDARAAIDLGADAIVVSNHGGRQLDGALSTARAFPAIAQAAGDRVELIFDGGVRSGLDVLRALGLGAKSCLIGRAYLYGLAVAGEAGVRTALDILAAELDIGMALTGVRDVNAVPEGLLVDVTSKAR